MKRNAIVVAIACTGLPLGGCGGHLAFGEADPAGRVPPGSVPYYAPMPAIVISVSGNCTVTTTPTAIADPTKLRWVKPKVGYGSSNLSANFSGGMLSSFGQTSDNKVPETITAVSGLVTSAAGVAKALDATKDGATSPVCQARAALFVWDDGLKTWKPLPGARYP